MVWKKGSICQGSLKKKNTGRHKRTSNGKSMQQQCTLSIVWSQAFSFPASISRYYYRAKWLPGRFYLRFEFQFGHSSTGGPTLMPFSLQRIPFLAKIQNRTNKKSGMEILLLSKFFGHVIKNLDGSGFSHPNFLDSSSFYHPTFFTVVFWQVLRVLGLSDFTSPWTFAKTTTPIYISR